MRILVFCATYLPAYKSGGTVRSIAGLVSHLGREHEFYILAHDRDTRSAEPLPAIEPSRWQQRGNANVYYASARDLTPRRMAAVISSVNPEGYYVNSFFSPPFGMTPMLLRGLRAIPHRPLILAPHGELNPAALRLGMLKKQAFLQLARRLSVYSDVLWHAGNPQEAVDIARAFGASARTAIARDLTVLQGVEPRARVAKQRGELSLACVARITPIKNIASALRMLRHVRGRVRYDVFGPVDKPAYYEECVRVARSLPPNIVVSFKGDIPNHRVIDMLSTHHGLFLPSLGESFSHAILEALLAGCVPVISDQTPWRNLRALGAGWDLPLSNEDAFVQALQEFVDMGDEEFAAASSAARTLGVTAARSPTAVAENRALLSWLGR